MPTERSYLLAVVLLGGAVLLAGCGSSSAPMVPGAGGADRSGHYSNTSAASSNKVLGCEPIASPSGIRKAMFDALNGYRTRNGLSVLAYSATLEQAADAHAKDMFRRNYFEHENPDGDGPLERVMDAGFCDLRFVAENIAMGQRSVEEVQLGWQNSPGHNANMLDHRPNLVGMGYYASPTGVQYWVQEFARSGSFTDN